MHQRTIAGILQNQSYIGDVVNFKTYSKSFKLKKRLENDKESWEIHKNAHEPIIDRELFEIIQKTFKTMKCQKPRHIEKNIFAGLVLEDKKHELNADGFLKIVRKYSEIEELTLDILQEFIDKIVVNHREEIMGETIQKIEIYYKMIGHIEISRMSKLERESLIKNFGRKKKKLLANIKYVYKQLKKSH